MTFRELQMVVVRVRFCGLFSGLLMRLDLCPDTDDVRLTLSMPVPERETGLPSSVHTAQIHPLMFMERWTEADVVRWLYNAFRRLVSHEMDEAFLYDGVRPYDPHERDDRLKRGEPVRFPMLPDRNHGQPMNPSGGAGDDAPAPYGLAQTNTPSSAGPRERVPAERISPNPLSSKPPGSAPGDADSGT